MTKRNISMVILLILLFLIVSSRTFAIQNVNINFVNSLVSEESWVSSQFLSYYDIRYKNDPEFVNPPSCDYYNPAVIISNMNNMGYLYANFPDENNRKIKMIFSCVQIPEKSPSNSEDGVKEGIRNKIANNDLILTGEKVTVDAYFEESKVADLWELYINGNQLGKDKYWLVTSFIINGETIPVYQPTGENAKVCSYSEINIKDDNAAKYYRIEQYKIFDHKAEYEAKIESDNYDVTKSIPTSEKITTSGWIDNADYYIKVRTTIYKAEVKGVNVRAIVSYSYDGKSGEEIAQELNHNVSVRPKTYYDVPVSDVSILTEGFVNASNGTYSIGECNIDNANLNLNGSGKASIKFTENFEYIKKEDIIKASVGGNFSSLSEAKSAALKKAKELVAVEVARIDQVLSSSFEAQNDSVKYRFSGLTVDENGIHGAPSTRYNTIFKHNNNSIIY